MGRRKEKKEIKESEGGIRKKGREETGEKVREGLGQIEKEESG